LVRPCCDDQRLYDDAQGLEVIRHALLLSVLAVSSAGAAAEPAAIPASESTTRELTVCADPNNLPFSNKAEEGFENKIASLIARDMGAKLTYVWWAQRRGYARSTLNEGKCDMWPGVAKGVDRIATSRPYYHSTYLFVTRKNAPLQGLTLDDQRLRSLTIGVQMIGNDAMNTPPAHSLSRRGIVDNVRGYMLYGNYETPNPPAAIIDAVAKGDVDVALVWGPLAGYFAAHSAVPLRLERVTPVLDDAIWPMTYGISVGVNRRNPGLLAEVERILDEEQPTIDTILSTYALPSIPMNEPRERVAQ
jgi:mxaJ protein